MTEADRRRQRQQISIGYIPAPAGLCGQEGELAEWIALYPHLATEREDTDDAR